MSHISVGADARLERYERNTSIDFLSLSEPNTLIILPPHISKAIVLKDLQSSINPHILSTKFKKGQRWHLIPPDV